MRWVRHLEALHDFIGLVVLYAPDRFRREDFLADHDQLDLDRAFSEMRSGLDFVVPRDSDPMFQSRLRVVLDESLAAYRSGDRKNGAHRLLELQRMIFGTNDEPS